VIFCLSTTRGVFAYSQSPKVFAQGIKSLPSLGNIGENVVSPVRNHVLIGKQKVLCFLAKKYGQAYVFAPGFPGFLAYKAFYLLGLWADTWACPYGLFFSIVKREM